MQCYIALIIKGNLLKFGFYWIWLDIGLPLWGARGRVFKSLRPDQYNQRLMD